MLKVLKPGFFTTIQDTGRFGLLNKGVPVSGQMDCITAEKINLLLENDPTAALMEITMTGPTLEFEADTYICYGGSEMSVTLNNEPLEAYTVTKVNEGDILSYGRLIKGFRNYLGIKNGFQTKKVLGSRSFYFPLTEKNHITERMEIDYEAISDFKPILPELKVDSHLEETVLQVTPGPEHGLLTDDQLSDLFQNEFTVAKENDRMAYQLNFSIPQHHISMLTSATMPGTVQLTPAGKLIILMKDGQTTGGYPRILQLTEEAIAILAQKKSGDKLSFAYLSS
ncbi:biotin-dependent carboxyltransferase family protein [Aggregatimonas sangjinii]|uniref:Biotin-dependent carboxyltransferase family protein n=1 Tax=Aggregatimonas sangjinii TaxID=2583587 RepID=A0A5B7SNW1_9FLAO|nr:biotin-dependent carboxyltransferase family protein [Aggregatimonas sangjinii]QCW99841.1 biotin-dependent carboxyltransferase family protein [Aggregatimonas sangjinii]